MTSYGPGAAGERQAGGTEEAPEEPCTIRPLESLADLQACCRLQEEVWGRGFGEAAPVSILKVTQRLGGLVGGALDGNGDLIGFVFGLSGLEQGRPIHWSHMLAVRPGLRDGGLGRQLKAWQRARCLESGVHRMYWSFDPLESRNGWLNLGRLGVVVREYVESMYGRSDSPLHQGLDTDRFVALWLLDGERAEARLEGRGAAPPRWKDVRALPRAFPVHTGADFPRPGTVRPAPELDGDDVLVPIPADIQRIRDTEPALARDWRMATREALGERVGRGWEVRELVRGPDGLSYYLLVRAGADG